MSSGRDQKFLRESSQTERKPPKYVFLRGQTGQRVDLYILLTQRDI
jgi:hypothetical protein